MFLTVGSQCMQRAEYNQFMSHHEFSNEKMKSHLNQMANDVRDSCLNAVRTPQNIVQTSFCLVFLEQSHYQTQKDRFLINSSVKLFHFQPGLFMMKSIL